MKQKAMFLLFVETSLFRLFAALTITATTLLVRFVVRIHLIGAIIVIRSVRRIVRIVLICVVIELTMRMSIP